MSLLDLAAYHVSPWLLAGAVVAPFAVRAWRRLPRERMGDDIAGQVHDGPYCAMRRGMEGERRG